MIIRSVFFIQLTLGLSVNAANLCFFPGGVQARDVPCDPSAAVSMCCGSVAACLSNGLCKDESTTNSTGVSYARGTCTDRTWQSPICPQNCQLNQDTSRNSSAFDFRFNGVQVWECNAQGFGVPADYCCESASEKTRCCATKSAFFTLLAASPGNALAVQTFNPTPTTSSSIVAPTFVPIVPVAPVPIAPPPMSSTTGPTVPIPTPTVPLTTSSTTTNASTTSKTSASASALAESFTGYTTTFSAARTTPVQVASSSPPQNSNGGGISTGGVVVIGVGASISSAVLVGCVVVFALRRWKPSRPDPSDGLNGSSFYGGNPILTKAQMIQRDQGDYPDSPISHERRGAMLPGMERLRIPELQSINDGNPYSSPSHSELEDQVSPRSKGRRPSTKVYELA